MKQSNSIRKSFFLKDPADCWLVLIESREQVLKHQAWVLVRGSKEIKKKKCKRSMYDAMATLLREGPRKGAPKKLLLLGAKILVFVGCPL